MTEERALAIVSQGKSVDSLLVTELDALLAWHKADKTKGAKKADKLEHWKKILLDGQQLLEYERWTEKDHVIGHGIGGILIPVEMARLTKS